MSNMSRHLEIPSPAFKRSQKALVLCPLAAFTCTSDLHCKDLQTAQIDERNPLKNLVIQTISDLSTQKWTKIYKMNKKHQKISAPQVELPSRLALLLSNVHLHLGRLPTAICTSKGAGTPWRPSVQLSHVKLTWAHGTGRSEGNRSPPLWTCGLELGPRSSSQHCQGLGRASKHTSAWISDRSNWPSPPSWSPRGT